MLAERGRSMSIPISMTPGRSRCLRARWSTTWFITLGTAKTVTIGQAGQRGLTDTFSGALNQRISLKFSGSTIDGGEVSLVRPDGSTFATYFFDTSDEFIDPAALDVVGTWSLVAFPNLDANRIDHGACQLGGRSDGRDHPRHDQGRHDHPTRPDRGLHFSGAVNQRITLKPRGSTIDQRLRCSSSARTAARLTTYYFSTSTDQFIDPTVLDDIGDVDAGRSIPTPPTRVR